MKYSEEQIESLLDDVSELLSSYKKADDEYKDNQDRENWKSKFGDRIGKYSDKLKLLNGDDWDVLEETRHEYNDAFKDKDISDDDYVDAWENNLKPMLSRIWPEEKVEEVSEAVKEAENKDKGDKDDGILTVATVGKDVTGPEDDNAPGKDTDKAEEDTEVQVDDDPVKQEYNELLKYAENHPQKRR